MKVYVAMICDRHSDPEPHVFTAPEAAITFALATAREFAHDEDDIDQEPTEGWMFHARYSTEGDSVWVIEKEIQEAGS